MLIDTTLREGAQLYGCYFETTVKKEILGRLFGVGVEEVEIGWVGREDVPGLLAWARERRRDTALALWSPCRVEDVRLGASLKPDRLHMGVPASDRHRELRLGLSREELHARMAECIHEARRLGVQYISVGLEDISRADPDMALASAREAVRHGAARVRLSDTVGLLTPLEISPLVKRFKEAVAADLAVHCHNDFGMATANAVTALSSGADYADVSVLGIGERAGIAALEEVAAHRTINQDSPRYNLDRIGPLAALVSKAANVALPRTKPVVGKDIFSCESGLHVHGLAKAPDLFEPFAPEHVSRSRILGVGGKSGRAAVRAVLEELDTPCPDTMLPGLTASVRSLSLELGRPLTKGELTQLCRRLGEN